MCDRTKYFNIERIIIIIIVYIIILYTDHCCIKTLFELEDAIRNAPHFIENV